MKVLYCKDCGSIHSFPADGQWRSCDCGQMRARWTDSGRGRVEVDAKDKQQARIIGLHNHMLMADPGTNQDARDAHDNCTNAPDYIFDKSRRACWAAIVRVGQTSDIRWAATEASGA